MNSKQEMKVTYIDPNQRHLYVAENPEGGYAVWFQKGKDVPRKLRAGGIKPEGYATEKEAQNELDCYVACKRGETCFARWDVLVNGKATTYDDMCAMVRGEIAPPAIIPDAQVTTLRNIEYRIGMHMQGAFREFLMVGRCLNEAKDAGLVPHGEWESWVRRNTGMSERQAQKLMQVARNVHFGSAMERLPISKIQVLLALPESEREDVADRAVREDTSLRDLREQVKAMKREKEEAVSLRAMADAENRRVTEKWEKAAEAANELSVKQQAAEKEIDRLKGIIDALGAERAAAEAAAYEKGQQAGGISPEVARELEAMRAEVERLEAFAARQAKLRQEAQEAMLSMESEGARAAAVPQSFGEDELAQAVRTFVAAAGVLPHIGHRLKPAERARMSEYVEMVAEWVRGAARALGTSVTQADGEVIA